MFKNKSKSKPDKSSAAQSEAKKMIDLSKGGLFKNQAEIKDFLAPAGFDLSDANLISTGDRFSRSFILNGYPSYVSVGWLNPIIHYDGDLDVSMHIIPAEERESLEELTFKITQLEAQLLKETESGSIKHVTRLRAQIEQLYEQRIKLEQNLESLFNIAIAATLHSDTKERLAKEYEKLSNRLKGRKINLSPAFLRQDLAYKSVLPVGVNMIDDAYRNINSGALTATFPFYNSEVSHQSGIFLGTNLNTGSPVLIDFFSRQHGLTNSNLTVFGESGSGKTFLVSLMTMRSALRGVRTAIIDPEGEYSNLVEPLAGQRIKISADSPSRINPFDIEEEVDEESGVRTININDKAKDILNLIQVMAGGLSAEEKSIVSTVLVKLYAEFGFTNDPESLYEEGSTFDVETGQFEYSKKKRMPTFSDFHDLLDKYVVSSQNERLSSLCNSLIMFKKGNIYDLFDCQTSESLMNLGSTPLIVFDVSELEESILRPIGMYIALTWVWEKFVKKNPEEKKSVILEEAWMLVNPNMAGHEYTSQFLDTASRRIRKRNGSLVVASQGFSEFARNPQGQAVLKNSAVNIFLKHSSVDVDDVQNVFKLSEGEKQFIATAKRGEALIKMGSDAAICRIVPFQYEFDLITSKDYQK